MWDLKTIVRMNDEKAMEQMAIIDARKAMQQKTAKRMKRKMPLGLGWHVSKR